MSTKHSLASNFERNQHHESCAVGACLEIEDIEQNSFSMLLMSFNRFYKLNTNYTFRVLLQQL